MNKNKHKLNNKQITSFISNTLLIANINPHL